jgi:hypothetical protein
MVCKRVSTWLVALTAAVAFAAAGAPAQEKPAQEKADTHALLADLEKVFAKHDVIDLGPVLKTMLQDNKVKDGVIPLTDKGGVRIGLRLKGGKSEGLVVTDKEGKELPTTRYELSMREPGQRAPRIHWCYECWSDGSGTHCGRYPCVPEN